MPGYLTMLNDSTMTLFSVNQKSLFEINIKKDLLPKRKIKFDEGAIRNVIPISSKRYISLGSFEEGRYSLLNEKGEILSYHFDYPSSENGANLSTPLLKYLAFQGQLTRKPGGYFFYFAGRKSEIFEIIKLDDADNLSKVFAFIGEIAQFVPEGDGVNTASVAVKRESKMFFIDSYCTDKYIYLLYSKKVIGDNIYNAIKSNNVLVFDWDGKAVTKLVLDKEVNFIAIKNDNTCMFAYDKDNDQLLRFQLKIK